MEKPFAEPMIDEWLRQQQEEAASYAYPAGLYGLPDEYKGIVGAKVRAKARELYGEPGADLVALSERQIALINRRGELLGKIEAHPLRDSVTEFLATDVARALPSWRVGAVVSITFALWGLLRHERTWDGWAVLLLSAALTTLILQALPVLLRFVVGLSLRMGGCLRNVAGLLIVDRKLAQLQSTAHREEDLRQRLNQWVEEKTALLLAEYEHNKNMALRARMIA